MKRMNGTGTPALLLAVLLVGLAACPQPEDPAPKKSGVTVEQLQAKVDEANALLKDENGDFILFVSEDGTDIDPAYWWVTEDKYSALDQAISAAKEDIDAVTENPSEKIWPDTLPNLIAAINAVTDPNTGRQKGTFGEGKIKITGTVAGAAWGTVTVYSTTNDKANSTLRSVEISKKTTWEMWIDEAWADGTKTVYADFVFTNTNNAVTPPTSTDYTSGEVSIAIPELSTLTDKTHDAGVLTISGPVFDEFQNIAPFATASSTNGASSVQNVNDGATSTRWDSGSLTPTLELDFKVPVQYNYVVLRSRSEASPSTTIQDFNIKYWDDTANSGAGGWSEGYAEANAPGTIFGSDIAADAKYGFPIGVTRTTSKLQLEVTAGKNNGNTVKEVSLFEIEVYLVPDRTDFAQVMKTAEDLLRDTRTSMDGKDVISTEKWTSTTAYITFKATYEAIRAIYWAQSTDLSTLNTKKGELDAANTSFATSLTSGTKTPKPTADGTSVKKAAAADSSVVFTLTSTVDGTWAVYEAVAGPTLAAGVTATFNSTNSQLTLSASANAISARQYWVGVTAAGLEPSDRLGLTVAQADGQSPQPQIAEPLALKEAANTAIAFTFNAAAYTGTTVWAVYKDENKTAEDRGVTIAAADSTLTLSHVSDVPYGDYWVAVNEDSVGESEVVKLTVARPLKVVRASIDDANRTTLVLEFADNVTSMETSIFQVKVNTLPKTETFHAAVTNNTVPWLDLSMGSPRMISAASATADAKVWNLTMSAAAEYGEIIRLAALSSGGANSADAVLPAMPGLIVKNGVKRTKHAEESTAGFHVIDGLGNVTRPLSGGTEGLKEAIVWLDGQKVQNGYTYILSVAQDYSSNHGVWWLAHNYTYDGTQRVTFIITSADGNPHTLTDTTGSNHDFGFNAGGVTIIIDENITYKSSVSANNYHIFSNSGRIILDGGTIETITNGDRKGAVGGPACYFIVNSGTITTSKSQLGPVFVGSYGAFVMHDGTITANEGTSGGTGIKSGGVIAKGGETAATHGSVGFYMTGGSIKNNKVTLNGGSGAGGVLWAGEFQKTGGSIDSNTIQGTNTANNMAANIVVMKVSGANPEAGSSFTKAGDSGNEDTLFIECIKAAGATAGTLKVPSWGASSWD
jgi:hypothetical protein